jgi:cellobiose-specific phosphotransferase system component IIA
MPEPAPAPALVTAFKAIVIASEMAAILMKTFEQLLASSGNSIEEVRAAVDQTEQETFDKFDERINEMKEIIG